MKKVAVINVPYKLSSFKEGAASLHIGHSIAILRNECKDVGYVEYIDYNFEEFRVFSALIYEYIDAYKDKYFSTFQKYESLNAIIRIILEEMMGVDIGLSNYLNIPESDVKKLVEAARYAFSKQLEIIKRGSFDSIILYAANNVSLLFILTKFIQKYKKNTEIIVMDQFTFEPVTPYLQSVYTHKDITGNEIKIFQEFDPLATLLEEHMSEMIDTVVVGEGYDYLRKKFNSEEILPSYKLNEVIFESPNGRKCSIVQSERVELDTLPFPDYSDMNDIYEFADIEFQRGCTFECVFLERNRMMRREIKYHSPDYIVKMIKHIKTYGFKRFTVIDCALNNNQQYMLEVLKAIDSQGLDIEYQGNLRTQETCDELIRLLKRTGCSVIALGIENGDEDVLKSMNKKQNLSKMLSLLEKISNNGISLMLFLIIGFPTENLINLSSTVELLVKIKEHADIEIIEIEFYHAGHIQKLQPNVYDEYGIEWKNSYEGMNLKDSSFNFFKPGVFGSAFYKRGMSRVDLASATNLYVKHLKENKIRFSMLYY